MTDPMKSRAPEPGRLEDQIPVLFCCDLEGDDRVSDPKGPNDWKGLEASLELFARFRHRLEGRSRSPVNFSWFLKMDPQVAQIHGSPSWVVARYSEAIRRLQNCGDAVGLHVHPWRWRDDSRSWVAEFGDQAWIEHSVRMGVDAFQSALAKPCRMFRFGDRWMNDETIALLEALGVQIDLTIEMGQEPGLLPEIFTGSRPDYSDVPRHPYHPSRKDFRREDPADPRLLWCIPISGASVRSPTLPLDRRPSGESWVVSRGSTATSGTIVADPNPIPVPFRGAAGATTVRWVATGTERVEIHVHAPDGPLFCSGGPSGEQRTGDWVTNGTLFFLQDASDGEPQSPTNTLACLRLYATIEERDALPRLPGSNETMTLDLAFNSLLFSRVASELLETLPFPYLAIVVRSDAAVRQSLRFNVEQNLDFIANHPLAERFVFECPEAMIQRFEATTTHPQASSRSA